MGTDPYLEWADKNCLNCKLSQINPDTKQPYCNMYKAVVAVLGINGYPNYPAWDRIGISRQMEWPNQCKEFEAVPLILD